MIQYIFCTVQIRKGREMGKNAGPNEKLQCNLVGLCFVFCRELSQALLFFTVLFICLNLWCPPVCFALVIDQKACKVSYPSSAERQCFGSTTISQLYGSALRKCVEGGMGLARTPKAARQCILEFLRRRTNRLLLKYSEQAPSLGASQVTKGL